MRFSHKAIEALAALLLATPFVGCTGGTSSDQSALSGDSDEDCTLTQGYWKNHPDAWPVSSLKLGSVTYTKDELLAILKTPVRGNGLVSLAHQLIAAKLNVAAGADDAAIDDAIDDADDLIGSLVVPPKGDGSLSTSATASVAGQLDDFNNGKIGPGHCDDNGGGGSGETCDHDDDGDGHCDTEPACGNGILEEGEQCDDGNTIAGDGCCDLCEIEVPACGNGIVEQGEECDDGNLVSGDGCSSACACECPH
jgi:cysteine-rich repeat protein